VLGFDRIDPARPPAQWATYGVLYSKGEVKLTSFGKPYMTVRVFDMDRRLANVTLLDGAVDAVLTVRTGTAIVIGAAEVTKRDSHVPGYQRPPPDFKPVTWGLTISFPGQIMVLGTASDFSQCTGNVSGRDGVHRCSVWLNNKDRRHLLCLEHSKRELQHATSSRGQFRYDVQKTVAATGYRIPTGMMSAAPSPAAVVNATVAAAAAAATADTPAVSSAEPARRLDLEMQLDPFGDIDSGGALRGVSVSDLVERESAARRRAQASKAIDQLFGSDEESDAEPDAALARVKLEPAVAGAGARAGAGTEGSSLTTSLSAGARADARRAHSRVERDEKLSQLPPAAPTVFDKHIAAAECKADADPGAGSKLGRGTAKAQQAAALASFDVTAAVTAALGPSRPPAPVAIKTAPTESTSASAPAPAVGVGAGVNASLMRGRGAQCVQRAVTLELAARLNVPGQPPTASVSAASAAAAAAAGVGAGSLYRRASGGATVATLHSVATVQKAGADNATLRGFVTSPGYDAGTGALNGSSITEAPGLRPQPPHGQPSAVEAQQQLRVRAEAEAAADAAAVRARASAAAAELARESAELEQQQAELERMQRDVEEQRRKVQAKLRAQQQAQQQQSLVPQVSAAVAAMAAAEAPRVPAPRPVQPPTTATAGAGAGAAGAGVVAGDVSSASLARARSLYGPSAAARASAAVQLSGSPAAYAAPSALPQTPGTGVTTGLLTGVTGRPAPAPAPAVAPVNAALQRAKDQLAVLAAVKQEAGAVAASPATGATARPTDLMAPAVYVPGSGGSAAAARVSSGTNTGASSAAANAAARNQLSRALFGEAASKDSRFLSVRANSSTSQAQAMVAAAAAPWAGVAPVRAPSSAAADAALLANAVTDATLAPASAHVSGLAQFAAVQRQATGQIKRPVPGAATVDAADDATASANGGGCETEPAEAAEERARLIELYGYDPSARFAEQAAQGLALNKEVVATEKRRRLDEQLDRAARAEQLDEKLQEKKQQNTVLFKCSGTYARGHLALNILYTLDCAHIVRFPCLFFLFVCRARMRGPEEVDPVQGQVLRFARTPAAKKADHDGLVPLLRVLHLVCQVRAGLAVAALRLRARSTVGARLRGRSEASVGGPAPARGSACRPGLRAHAAAGRRARVRAAGCRC
jgi:hypothetical protein